MYFREGLFEGLGPLFNISFFEAIELVFQFVHFHF